jgi:hypothetical protein
MPQHSRDRKPPFLLELLVDVGEGCEGMLGCSGFSEDLSAVAGRVCCERLLLAVLPALRFPVNVRLDPRPMLSEESATVAPLKPVPVGVGSSCGCDEDSGTFKRDRFRRGWPSVAEDWCALASAMEPFRCSVPSVERLPCEDAFDF